MRHRVFIGGRAIYMAGAWGDPMFLAHRAREAGLLPPYRAWTDPSVDGYYVEGDINPCYNEDKEWP